MTPGAVSGKPGRPQVWFQSGPAWDPLTPMEMDPGWIPFKYIMRVGWFYEGPHLGPDLVSSLVITGLSRNVKPTKIQMKKKRQQQCSSISVD